MSFGQEYLKCLHVTAFGRKLFRKSEAKLWEYLSFSISLARPDSTSTGEVDWNPANIWMDALNGTLALI